MNNYMYTIIDTRNGNIIEGRMDEIITRLDAMGVYTPFQLDSIAALLDKANQAAPLDQDARWDAAVQLDEGLEAYSLELASINPTD